MRCEENAPNNLQAVRDRSGKDVSGQCLEDNHLVNKQPKIATRLLLIALAEAKMNAITIIQSFANHSMSAVFVSVVYRTSHVNVSSSTLSSP